MTAPGRPSQPRYAPRGSGRCWKGHERRTGAGSACVTCNRDRRRWTRVAHLFDALLADLALGGPTLTQRRKATGL